MRDRLAKSPVGEILTLTEDISLHECENFILEGAVQRYNFAHWLDHLVPLHIKLTQDYKDRAYKCAPEFESLRTAVSSGLRREGFDDQADEVSSAKDEETLNRTLIRQYTEETPLYGRMNRLLRAGHTGQDVSDSGLTPWICQLAAAIRQMHEYPKIGYRGSELEEKDLDRYTPGLIFVWAPFTSASKDISSCFGGNVIFELKPVSALSERDKRAPRDIALGYWGRWGRTTLSG